MIWVEQSLTASLRYVTPLTLLDNPAPTGSRTPVLSLLPVPLSRVDTCKNCKFVERSTFPVLTLESIDLRLRVKWYAG